MVARRWAKVLIEYGIPKESLYAFATGCEESMPKPTPNSAFFAISLAGKAVERAGTSRRLDCHGALMEYIATQDDFHAVYENGKRTKMGLECDETWPVGR